MAANRNKTEARAQPAAEWSACYTDGTEMAEGLDEKSDDDAGEGRGVMGEGPDDGENAERADCQGDDQQAHFFVAQREGQAWQKQDGSPPEERAA